MQPPQERTYRRDQKKLGKGVGWLLGVATDLREGALQRGEGLAEHQQEVLQNGQRAVGLLEGILPKQHHKQSQGAAGLLEGVLQRGQEEAEEQQGVLQKGQGMPRPWLGLFDCGQRVTSLYQRVLNDWQGVKTHRHRRSLGLTSALLARNLDQEGLHPPDEMTAPRRAYHRPHHHHQLRQRRV